MYAIIEESGGQRTVRQGEEILVDLLGEGQSQVGQAVSFDKVLVIGEAGGSAKVGQPYVTGAKVGAEVVEAVVMGEKLDIHKFRAKKAYKKKTGHRQRFTLLRVTSITG